MKKILIIILLLVFTGCNKYEKLEPNKVNLNEKVIEDKKIDGLSMTNTSLIYESGITTFKTTITNNGKIIKNKKINLIFKNTNNSIIVVLKGYISKLEKLDKTEFVVTSDIDLTDAYLVEYSFE